MGYMYFLIRNEYICPIISNTNPVPRHPNTGISLTIAEFDDTSSTRLYSSISTELTTNAHILLCLFAQIHHSSLNVFWCALFPQDSTSPHLHSCKQLRLRGRVWLVPDELPKAQLVLIRTRAALRVKVGDPDVLFALRKAHLNKSISGYRLNGCTVTQAAFARKGAS